MNAIELRDYYRSRQQAHEELAAKAGESYIAKIHLDLAARYAALTKDEPQADPATVDQRQSVLSITLILEDSLSTA
ncbi:hypothetical protein [Sphingomonas sp.]|uniref:hypothetical protein n=1 Tax=Sphingomonas sp. TaxID=28214 RepID=UPI00286C2B9C|nr:hypothetical protein [Sphingomonas sp.]